MSIRRIISNIKTPFIRVAYGIQTPKDKSPSVQRNVPENQKDILEVRLAYGIVTPQATKEPTLWEKITSLFKKN
ncbi:hypothetical protein II906_03870 [bacterium]|nr:hypothetical protein [bacterium]